MRCAPSHKKADNQGSSRLRFLALLTTRLLILQASVTSANTPALTCPYVCSQTTDYQHPSSILQFSRNHYSDDTVHAVPNNLEDNHSRHRFEIVLTQDGSSTIIFDQFGNQHIFVQDRDGRYVSSTQSGSLSLADGTASWTTVNGDQYLFQGSYLTRFIDSSGQSLTMTYFQRRLLSITDDDENTLTLEYDDNRLVELITPAGETIPTPARSCFNNDEVIETCDVQNNPIADFESTHTRDGTVRLDARPHSCESYFIEYFGTERGAEIERGLANHSPYDSLLPTVRSYPIVDFIDDNRLLVVRSRDLANPSFNDVANPNALLYRLMRDGREIQTRFLTPLNEQGQVSATEDGRTTTISLGSEPPNIVLQLIVRDQIASPTHWAQITQARDQLFTKYGIALEVIIIP